MFRTTFDTKKKQWNGLKTQTVFNPKSSLGNVILNVLQVNSSRIAQVCADTNKTTTFDELYDQIVCVASNLRGIGCKQGEVVFFFTNNSADLPAITFAAFCLGCPVSAIGKFHTKRETLHYLNIARPKYVFCDLDQYERLKECFDELNNRAQFFTFDGQTDDTRSVESLFEKSNSDSIFVATELDGTKETAFIARSSGTTGLQKGIPISHASILDYVRRASPYIRATDVVYTSASIPSPTGLVHIVAATLNASTRIVNFGTFTPERFFDVTERLKVSVVVSGSGPLAVKQLLNHPQIETADLSSLKQYICGGEKVPLEIIRKMNTYLKHGKLCQGYGMTETIGGIAINLDHDRNDSVGQLVSGCEVKIVNDNEERLGVGEEGEIYVKQPFPFTGYLNSDNSHCFDNEGFFITGDIGQFDENGDLFIVGRKREMFKVAGKPVTPAEIEEFLNKINSIEISCMVPIPHPEYDFIPAVQQALIML